MDYDSFITWLFSVDKMTWFSIIGMLTGIVGAAIGIISLRKVNKIKSLDLRLEYGRLKNRIEILLNKLLLLSVEANQSRINCYAAIGMSKSGPMQKWQESFKEKGEQIKDLSAEFQHMEESDVSNDIQKLESDILKYHLIEERVKASIEYFNNSMKEDDLARANLREERLNNPARDRIDRIMMKVR